MQNWILRWAPPLLGAVCCLLLFQIVTTRPLPDVHALLEPANLKAFRVSFIGIVLEALPFILLGVLISAILHLFVSEALVRRMMPRNPVLGVLFACLLGFLFPVCECGMVPVIRRLLGKGMPLYIAVVFLLAGPVVNPVTYASTYMAFEGEPRIAYVRLALAFAVAAAVGLALYRLARGNPLRLSSGLAAAGAPSSRFHVLHGAPGNSHSHSPGTSGRRHSHDHDHSHGNKLTAMIGHASEEFFEMGKYLIIGAGITALVQTFVSPESLLSIGQSGLGSHLFMAVFAFALSLCSSSDAFIASTFAPYFSPGSLLTFLVIGPMVSFKGTLMLLTVFRGGFVVRLSLLTAAAVLGGAFLMELAGII